jgi:hypothetical protein
MKDSQKTTSAPNETTHKYQTYMNEIKEKGIEKASPRAARELLKAKKGVQSEEVKSFINEHKKELLARENAGRVASKSR